MKQEEKLLRLLNIQALVDSRDQDSIEPFRAFMIEEHIRNISKEIEEYKHSQDEDPLKDTANDTVNDTVKVCNLSKAEESVLAAVGLYPTYTYEKLAAYCNLSRPTVARAIKTLQNRQLIRRVGSDKTGHWEVVKGKENNP